MHQYTTSTTNPSTSIAAYAIHNAAKVLYVAAMAGLQDMLVLRGPPEARASTRNSFSYFPMILVREALRCS
jgi:hypothetical protein